MLAAARPSLHILRARHQLRAKQHLCALPPRKDPWGIDHIMAPYFQFPEEDHPHVTIKNVSIAMRDGVKLAATVFRPSFDGQTPVSERLPVVLHRTPYNRNKSARTERCLLPDGTLSDPIDNPHTADRYARRGYCVVIQDCRGRYDSEGRFTKYVNEGEDGVDTLAWIMAQPWCNGKIGMFGLSYCAHVQVSLACLDPPGLAAMFLESGGFWDAYQDGVRYGGAFTMKQVTWAFKNAKVSPEVVSQPAVHSAMEGMDLHEWFRRVHEWREGYSPLTLAPDYERYIFHDWRAECDGPEWRVCGLHAASHLPRMADVPVMIICSWYDPYIGAMTDMFCGLVAAKTSPMRLVLGPWTHGDHAITYAGEVDFGPQSTYDRNVAPTFQAARAAWFDEHLHGRLPGSSPLAGHSPIPGSSPLAPSSPRWPGTSPVQGPSPQPGTSPSSASSSSVPSSPAYLPSSVSPTAAAAGRPHPLHTREISFSTGLNEHANYSPEAAVAAATSAVALEPPAGFLMNGVTSTSSNTTSLLTAARSASGALGLAGRAVSVAKGTPPPARSSGAGLSPGSPLTGPTGAGVLPTPSPQASGSIPLPPGVTLGRAGSSLPLAESLGKASSLFWVSQPPVKYFRMGGGSGCKNAAGRLDHGGEWLSSATWPPPFASRPIVLRLQPDGVLQKHDALAAPMPSMVEGDEASPSSPTHADGTLSRDRSFSRDSLNSSSKQQLGGLSRLLRASRGELGNSFGNLRTQEQQQSGEEQQHQQQQPGCSFAQESSLSGSLPHRACNGTPSKLQQSMQSEATEDHNLNCSSSSAVNLDTDGEQATQNYSRSTTQGGASCRSPFQMAIDAAVAGSTAANSEASSPTKHGGGLNSTSWINQNGIRYTGSGSWRINGGDAESFQAAAAAAHVVLTHDPLAPVPTIGGNITSGEPIMSGGAFDQVERPQFFGCSPEHTGRRLSEHPGVATWCTAPLECDMELTGRVRVVLCISSDAPDTDFHVTLIDEYPPSEDWPQGFSLGIASGIMRAHFRHGHLPHQVQWLVPGEVAEVPVILNVTSNLFRAGHRLRINVSCSSFPRYDINYGVTSEEHAQWERSHGILPRASEAERSRRAAASNREGVVPPSMQVQSDQHSSTSTSLGSTSNGGCQGPPTPEASYATLHHVQLSPEAAAALEQCRAAAAAAGAEVAQGPVMGRPYRVSTNRVYVGPLFSSRIELPAYFLPNTATAAGANTQSPAVAAVAGGGGSSTPGATPSRAAPLIPFSPKWLQRRPTWSR